MESVRVIIAMSSEAAINKMSIMFSENGYTVVDKMRNSQECLRKTRILKPDLIVLDYNLPALNGYELAKVIIEDKLCDVILIASAEQEGMFHEMESESGFICLQKPINRASLITAIGLMTKNRKNVLQLEKEIDELRASINARKEVEIAKGLLMRNLKMTEPEAFRKIQKQSMDKGIPMKDIAKAIILAYDI